MIQPSVSLNQSVHFHILSQDQIWEITQAAFDVLEKTGCDVLHAGARDMLRKAGAVVRDRRVRMPRFMVEAAVRTAPKGFVIHDRAGGRAMEVEGRKSHFGTSTGSPNTRDALTGEVHETRIQDIALAARVADALPEIDFVMPFGTAQDVPALAADLHEFEAVVHNTVKPVAFCAYTPQGLEGILEMAAAVAGGREELVRRPFVMPYPEPVSPLVFPENVTEKMLVAADWGVPQIPAPSAQPGGTAPVTLAGTVVQQIAEGLAAITLIQLRRPGAPCALAGNVGILNMANGTMSAAAPEMLLANGAQAEVARSFGLPTWGLAGATDAKSIDAQAGLESGFSILAQALSGMNLIHDVGYIDMCMICSVEMLVLGNEAIGMAKRFVRGLTVDRETLAREVIERVGPAGQYMTDRHTLNHFRKELWFPDLLTRIPYESWKKKGARDMDDRIQEKILAILDSHRLPELPMEVTAEIERIRKQREAEICGT